MFANVLLFQKTGLQNDILTYAVPEEMEVSPGALVEVPLRKQVVRGVVLELTDKKPLQGVARNISSIVYGELLPEWRVKLIDWLATTYHTPKSVIIKHLLPVYLREKKGVAVSMLEGLIVNASTQAQPKTSRKSEGGVRAILTQKQETLLQSLEEILEKHSEGQVFIITPEIAVAPFWTEMIEEKFNAINYTSAKTPKQKAILWKEVFEGKHRVIYGSRSTLLSPAAQPSAIIIINEHNIGHKEDQRPKFHSRDLALEIQKLTNCELIFLGPSISLPLHLELSKRHASAKTPDTTAVTRRDDAQIKIIDMKDERKRGNYSPLSEELTAILSATLHHKSQAIIFLNKRGDSSCLLCRDCGYLPKCHICKRNLIVQRSSEFGHVLSCIAGDVVMPVPEACPTCGNIELKMVGVGQDKLITTLEKLFPEARIELYSKERFKTPKEQAQLLKKFSAGKIDILITTQLLYAGAPIPLVPVVAALDIDTSLTIPHFMSSEKTLHHLQEMQTFLKPKGLLLLQSYIPDNPLLTAYRQQQLDAWYTKELKSRKTFNYPPYSKILVLTSTRREDGRKSLENTLKYIRATEPDLTIELNSKHIRHQEKHYLIIRGTNPEKAMEVIRKMPDVSLDIDSPYLV